MAVIKSLLAELVLCTLMLHPQAEVLPSDRLVSWVSQITLDENIDRFLLDKVEDDDICEALVDPLACDDEIGNSELSVKPPIPLHTEADMKGSDMGEPQSVESSDRIDREDILKRIAEAHVYMQTVMADEKLVKVRPICRNEHSLCTNWAVRGECENNPGALY